MINEQLKQTGRAYIAASEEKPWQWLDIDGKWRDPTGDEPINRHRCPLRPKPEPSTRHWNYPADVPEGIRSFKTTGSPYTFIPVEITETGIRRDAGGIFPWHEITSYSCDLRTFLPCEVTI